MSIHTIEDLDKSLSYGLAWRKRELISLVSILQSSKITETQKEVIVRGGVAILYAHWEGFVKESSSYYLEFVLNRRLTYKELSSNFISIAVKNNFEEVWKSNKISIINKITEFFISNLSERCKMDYKSVIDTQSNLSSEVLKEITYILGIDYSSFEVKKNIIDEKLLKSRNNIAHGELFTIDIKEFYDLYDKIIILLDLFKNLIENAASTKTYLRNPIK
jgi:hypothetical protein